MSDGRLFQVFMWVVLVELWSFHRYSLVLGEGLVSVKRSTRLECCFVIDCEAGSNTFGNIGHSVHTLTLKPRVVSDLKLDHLY